LETYFDASFESFNEERSELSLLVAFEFVVAESFGAFDEADLS
jgi:hypothetical protein